MSITPFVFLFFFLLLFLIYLDTKLFRALLKARAPNPVKDPSLSREEQLLHDLNQYVENLRWLNSMECERAVFIPGGALWLYVRDHYIRKQPWKTNMSA